MPSAAPLSRNGPCGTRARREVTARRDQGDPHDRPDQEAGGQADHAGAPAEPAEGQPEDRRERHVAEPHAPARGAQPDAAVHGQPDAERQDRDAQHARRRAGRRRRPSATSGADRGRAGDRERQPAVVEVDHEQRDAGGGHRERGGGVRRWRRSASRPGRRAAPWPARPAGSARRSAPRSPGSGRAAAATRPPARCRAGAPGARSRGRPSRARRSRARPGRGG